MTQFETFMQIYRRELAICQAEGLYVWPREELDIVADKMQAAFARGSYNNDSPAIKRACKELGIKTTHKAIDAYLKG